MSRVLPDVQTAIENLGFPYTLHYFAESLYSQPVTESVALGAATDIAGAVVNASAQRPSALLLVSDGNHNYGRTSLALIRDIEIPVYTFGIGARAITDAAINDVQYPPYVYVGDSVTIEVIVETQGFSEGQAQIMFRGKNSRDSVEVFRLSKVKAKHSINFTTFINEPAQQEYNIIIPPLPGEITTENNSCSIRFKIIDEKIDVFYFTDHLSFTAKFFRDILEQDERLKVDAYMKMPGSMYREINRARTTPTLPPLDRYDVLILDNVHFAHLPWLNIDDRINNGMGVLCIGSMEDLTPKWQEIMPIQTAGVAVEGTFTISVLVPFSCLDTGSEYPPFQYINRVTGIQKNATIIAESQSIPLIGYSRYGQGMLFQINAIDLGVWQFLQIGLRQHDILTTLLTDIVRFLSAAGRDHRLALTSFSDRYLVGETMLLTLQSFDRDFKRRGGGDFFVKVNGDLVPVFEEEKGVYTTSIIAPESGILQLKASGSLDGEDLVSNELTIIVREGNLEQDHGLNEDYLRTLSTHTGGTYSPFDSLSVFKPLRKKESTVTKFQFDNPLSYLIICILLAADWIIRRRKGIV